MRLDDIRATLSRAEAKLARLAEQRQTGRHRGEPKHHLGPLIVIGTIITLACTAIVTVFIVQGNPEPVAAQYQPSYNPTSPPHVWPPARQQASPAVSTYTVVTGDNLWHVARQQCGDGAKWREIYNASHLTGSPNSLHLKQQLVVPCAS